MNRHARYDLEIENDRLGAVLDEFRRLAPSTVREFCVGKCSDQQLKDKTAGGWLHRTLSLDRNSKNRVGRAGLNQ